MLSARNFTHTTLDNNGGENPNELLDQPYYESRQDPIIKGKPDLIEENLETKEVDDDEGDLLF